MAELGLESEPRTCFLADVRAAMLVELTEALLPGGKLAGAGRTASIERVVDYEGVLLAFELTAQQIAGRWRAEELLVFKPGGICSVLPLPAVCWLTDAPPAAQLQLQLPVELL